MKKTLLLIPGFGENTKEFPYSELISSAEKIGFNKIIEINPLWNYRTATDWYAEILEKLKDIDSENTVAVGFSLGAYVLLQLSEKKKFYKSIICSISPYFKEQILKMPKEAKVFFGKRRVEDFKKHSLPVKNNSKKIFIFGDQDWPYAIEESKLLAKIHTSEFKLVKDSGHELTNNYIKVIIDNLK